MAKKILRESPPEPVNYTLIGISCHLKDYRLSWLINGKLRFALAKQQDLVITLPERKEPAAFSFYSYRDEDQGFSYMLISNRSEEFVLIPEFKQLDFLLMVEGDCRRDRKETLVKAISSVPNVLTAYEIKPADIRNMGNLSAEIEMHLMKIFRKPKSIFEHQPNN